MATGMWNVCHNYPICGCKNTCPLMSGSKPKMECVYNHNGITCACATDGLKQCRYKSAHAPKSGPSINLRELVDNIRRTDLSKVGVDSITPEMKRADVSIIFEGATVVAGTAPQFGGRKDDTGKLPWHLIPWDAVRSIVKVLQFGAAKYAPRNWEKGMDWERVFRACIGHLTDWWERAPSDPETGFSHLWHAGCCIVFLIAYEIRGVGKDTRP